MDDARGSNDMSAKSAVTPSPRYISTIADIKESLSVLAGLSAGDRVYETHSGTIYSGGKGLGVYHLLYKEEGRAKTLERVEHIVAAATQYRTRLTSDELQRAASGVCKLADSFQGGSNIAETIGRVYVAESELRKAAEDDIVGDQGKSEEACGVVEEKKKTQSATSETEHAPPFKRAELPSDTVPQVPVNEQEHDASSQEKENEEDECEDAVHDEDTPLLPQSRLDANDKEESLSSCCCMRVDELYAKDTIEPPTVVTLPEPQSSTEATQAEEDQAGVSYTSALAYIAETYRDNDASGDDGAVRKRKKTRRGKRKTK